MVVCLYLLWGAWQDLRSKKIKNSYLCLGGIAGIISKIMDIVFDNCSFKEWLWALFPGMLLLVVAKATREKIGMGDGWVILILGNFLSVVEILYVFQTALLVIIVISIVLLCGKKIDREFEIPFLPFLWAAYTFLWRMHYV